MKSAREKLLTRSARGDRSEKYFRHALQLRAAGSGGYTEGLLARNIVPFACTANKMARNCSYELQNWNQLIHFGGMTVTGNIVTLSATYNLGSDPNVPC